MKKNQKQKAIPETSQDWRANVRVTDTVSWRLPPLNYETIGSAVINGKIVFCDKILNFGGKIDSSTTGVTEKLKCSEVNYSKTIKVKSNKEEDFLKPSSFHTPATGRRSHESKMEYNNPLSVFYCAKDSFQRFLDLSSCMTAEVKCKGSVLVPETSLESMIMKERTNASLVSHLPSPPHGKEAYYRNSLIVTEGNCDETEGQNGCLEISSVNDSHQFPVSSTVLQHFVSFCFDMDALLTIEFNCFSPFTLSKICAFTFEVCFDRTSLESSSSSYRRYPRKAFPSFTVNLQEISDTVAVLLCPMHAVTEDLLAGHQVVTTVTCCSKPKACLLRSQMRRIQDKNAIS